MPSSTRSTGSCCSIIRSRIADRGSRIGVRGSGNRDSGLGNRVGGATLLTPDSRSATRDPRVRATLSPERGPDPDPQETSKMHRPVLQIAPLAAVAIAGLGLLNRQSAAPANVGVLPNPTLDARPDASQALQTAVFAGGCFWGIEAV